MTIGDEPTQVQIAPHSTKSQIFWVARAIFGIITSIAKRFLWLGMLISVVMGMFWHVLLVVGGEILGRIF